MRPFLQVVTLSALFSCVLVSALQAQDLLSRDKSDTDIQEIHVAQVTFLGSYELSLDAQNQIAEQIKDKTWGSTVDAVRDEAEERARAGWQDRGYFKAQITSEMQRLGPQSIALVFRVDEGSKYRLGSIAFENNKAIANNTALRKLFPINDGDLFSRQKIADGLEKVRYAYAELGYLNFTSIPNTTFDEDKHLISLNIDMDEGAQFVIGSIEILGIDAPSQQAILKDAPIRVGQIFNARLLNRLMEKYPAIFQCEPDDPNYIQRKLDERAGTVAITIDPRNCN